MQSTRTHTTIPLRRMESRLSGCLPAGRRSRHVLVGIMVAIGLLACDMMVHLTVGLQRNASPQEEVLVADPKTRRRRSVDTGANESASVLNQTPVPKGAVFTRWGRSDCPMGAALLYKGVIGTGYNAHKGAGTDYLCMADAPEWLSHSSASKFGYVAGVEYQDNYMGINANQNAVCSTCQSTRANKLMIPGRTTCMSGWTREYYGYLMSSEHKEEGNHNFICVDNSPQADRAGYQAEGGSKIYHVRAACGALPCPKYVSNRVVACVMCTR